MREPFLGPAPLLFAGIRRFGIPLHAQGVPYIQEFFEVFVNDCHIVRYDMFWATGIGHRCVEPRLVSPIGEGKTSSQHRPEKVIRQAASRALLYGFPTTRAIIGSTLNVQ